jgi:uncharacterized protein with von Willebrand factor type A (vWA) domain
VTDAALLPNLLVFARLMRAAGLQVHAGRMLDCITALDEVGIRRRADVHATLRSLLVHRQEDLARFDEVFAAFWKAHETDSGRLPLFSLGERPRVKVAAPSGASVEFDDVERAEAAASRLAAGAYSPAEVSRTKDFVDFTREDADRAEALLADMAWSLGRRRTRRWSAAPHGSIDLRPILRRNMRHGGELVHVPRRRRIEKPRPLVVLCDVSGSMARYSRMVLQLVHGLARSAGRVESFLFATRLTRVTRQAGARDVAAVVTRLAHAVNDWGGGTRIGETLRAFNTRWARRVMRNGPVVLIVSDGWDRGDPDLVAREMARLRRRCHRVVWVNPLLGSANYEPLTRGLQAARPFVDEFLPAHNLVTLEQLAARLVEN